MTKFLGCGLLAAALTLAGCSGETENTAKQTTPTGSKAGTSTATTPENNSPEAKTTGTTPESKTTEPDKTTARRSRQTARRSRTFRPPLKPLTKRRT